MEMRSTFVFPVLAIACNQCSQCAGGGRDRVSTPSSHVCITGHISAAHSTSWKLASNAPTKHVRSMQTLATRRTHVGTHTVGHQGHSLLRASSCAEWHRSVGQPPNVAPLKRARLCLDLQRGVKWPVPASLLSNMDVAEKRNKRTRASLR